ncbi:MULTISPECIES: YgaP-like transmembrane domain [unclassified Lysinibacillus]|uniref:YgaP-like transmembrane domain n=1 Tax=unclassified Lysinibacillus TaxID=2636778 RepID=UPI002010E36F|nr:MULTISPECIES: YgaP-like transmembrane domain [unclassified Lysinibacillus]MCL1697841.1 DUF2892 domain-containing protein [Lysinibacillus sp. BPa_S21]MCL1702904.1 DUF2892 domain-containing protein [Lysinibacillus sp. Bpr_S20]
MMQETNLSEKNSFCRFAMGASLTAFGIAKISRNPECTKGRLMIAFGAMKMAEGIFKYCPTKALLSSYMQNGMNNSNNHSNSSGSGNSVMESMLGGQNSMSSEQIEKLMKDFSSAISGTTSGSNATTSKQSDASTSNQNSSESKSSAQNPS